MKDQYMFYMQKGCFENENYRSSTIRAIVILMLLIFNQNVYSQNHYQNFTNYTIDDGFQSMINYDVVQDKRGYIWIATDAGLSRFNGKEFKNYSLKEGLDQNEIVKMEIDSTGRIWLNSSGSISYIQNDSIVKLDFKDSRDLYWNFKVQSDNSNTWLSAKRNLYYLDENLSPTDVGIVNDRTLRTEDYLIVGMREDTTLLFHKDFLEFRKDGKLKRKLLLKGAYQNDQIQNHKFFQEGNELFYCGKKGLTKLNLNTGVSINISPLYTSTRGIHKIGNKIWISNLKKGMYCLTIENDVVVKTETYLKDKLCSNFIFDNKSNLWVATYGDGLYFFPNQFKGINNYSKDADPLYGDLQTVLVDEENIWMGKLDGGLLKMRGSKNTYYSYDQFRKTPINRILQIIKIDEDKLLMASDDGLLLFDNGSISVKHGMATKSLRLQKDSVIVNNYSYTYKVSVDDLINTEKTLSTSLMEEKNNIQRILEGRAYSSVVDSKNSLWIANTKLGLIEYTKTGQIINHTEKNNLLNVNIVDIVELENGGICLSTNGEGIIIINNNDIQQIDIEEGLSSDICFDIRAVGNILYVATNKGVNIIEFENDLKKRYRINILDKMDGLLSNDTRSIDYFENKLYVATSDGLSIVSLDDFKPQNELAPIQIENIEANQKQIDIEDKISLSYDQNSLRIDFSAISFIRNQQNVYAYRMSNVDEDWVFTTSNETQYGHLKHGEYKFEVKHANATDPSQIKSVSFKIKPHFTQTLWFKFLVALSLFGLFGSSLLYFISRGQKKELKKLVSKRTIELRDKISDLAESNSKLEKSNAELEKFAYITSHDLKSPLRSVGSFVELLLKKNKDKFDNKDKEYLHYILSSVSKMNQVIKDLLILSRIGSADNKNELVDSKEILDAVIENNSYLLLEKNAVISFEGDFPILDIHPTELGSLFQNFITNGVKYNNSAVPKIHISVEKSHDEWIFAIADNGIGINPKFGNKIFDLFQRLHTDKEYSGTGIGLSICKKVIEKNQGKIWFDSKLDQGSTFFFSLPMELSKAKKQEELLELEIN